MLVATLVMAVGLWYLTPELSTWYGLDAWQRAARLLGLTRDTLLYRLRKYLINA